MLPLPFLLSAVARLTSETIANDPNSANGTLNYSLDAAGNRLTRTSTLAAISSTASTYNANDRLNSDSYDANGNTTAANGASYSYNFENRLTSLITQDSSLITFTYDGDGNRVAKTVAGVTTRYLVDDLSPTGYAQVTEEVAGGSVQRTYTYGEALISQTQPGNSQTNFYGSDTHGSVRLLTNSAGTVSDTYDYEAFGNLVSASGNTPNDYLYSGERFDSDVGAYHLRERYYSPQRGRFLTSDPFAGFTELPRTLHKYLYVGADPVNYIDPSGLTETTEYKLRGTLQPKLKIPCSILKVKDLLNVDPALLLAAEAVELLICGCKPATGTSVGANLAAGKQLEREIADAFRDGGYDVTPNEYTRVPGYKRGRFLDVVVRKGGKIVVAIEAKVGKSAYRGAQKAKDLILKQGKLPIAVVRRLCR